MTDNLQTAAVRIRSARTRVVLIGAIVPVAMALVATILMVGWLPEVPDPIAVHWSGASADSFGPALPFIVTPGIFTLVFSGFAVAWSWRPTQSGRLIWNQKVLLVTSVWLSTLLSVGFAASISLQRGLSDAHRAPDVGPALAIAAGIGLVLALASWFVLPAGESINEPGADPTAVDLQGGERVSWSNTVRLGTAVLLVVGVIVLIGFAAVTLAVLSSPGSSVLGFIVMVVVVAVAISNFWWRVSADHRGLIVKGLLGWPRKHIRIEDIRSVAVVEVNPIRDFGGWGWRWAVDGRSGIVVRTGPGIEVTQSSGKRFIVTVDDAATGAGVLAALLARRT